MSVLEKCQPSTAGSKLVLCIPSPTLEFRRCCPRSCAASTPSDNESGRGARRLARSVRLVLPLQFLRQFGQAFAVGGDAQIRCLRTLRLGLGDERPRLLRSPAVLHCGLQGHGPAPSACRPASPAAPAASVVIGPGRKHFILDRPPVRFEALERPAHDLEQRFGPARVLTARRQVLNDLALLLKAFAGAGKAPVGHRKIAMRERHGYLPTSGDISLSTKGTANASTIATTRAAVAKRLNL